MKELRDKIAKENSFDDWEDLCFHYGELSSINRFDKLTKFVDEVALRHSQQYIDANKELANMLQEAKRVLSSVQSPRTPSIFCIREIDKILNKQSLTK